jgi:hypothetical protein
MKFFKLDDDNNAIPCNDFMECAFVMGDTDRRRVALDTLGDTTISTVFLGIATNIVGPPRMFETLVADENGGEVITRYSSWDEALEGHNKILEEIRMKMS